MIQSTKWLTLLIALAGLTLAGCETTQQVDSSPTIFFNITEDADDLHEQTMALQLAGHALNDGRSVVLFYNVEAVSVPTQGYDATAAFHDKPVIALLQDLIARGADVYACPHCMKAMDIEAADLLPGVKVASRQTLFAHLHPATQVFSY